MNPIKLHRVALSGHCHRVECFASMLKLPYELIDVDLANKAHKRPEFLSMNSFGLVPVIEDGQTVLSDSNAILAYLATRYGKGQSIEWLPGDPVKAAQVQRWLSVAAGPLALGPARARLKTVFNAPVDEKEAIARAHDLFAVLEAELSTHDFLVDSTPTIADISLYSYVAHAPEGNVSLQPYPAIRAWLDRIEALPGFVPMKKTAVGLMATESPFKAA